jgi:hypothetical protein
LYFAGRDLNSCRVILEGFLKSTRTLVVGSPFHHDIIEWLDVSWGFNMSCLLKLLPHIRSNGFDVTIHATFEEMETTLMKYYTK